ncbi:multicopper oxidase with phosphopantotheine [Nocardioides sp. CF8]|nr:multicopper oxidase with phosphopantotheine [Nocardioides sp. CF8]
MQGPEHRAQRRRRNTDLLQHPHRVGLRGRLDDPRQHELSEGLIVDGVEPEPGVGLGEDPPQQRRALARDQARPLRHALILKPDDLEVEVEVEGPLPFVQTPARLGHEHRQLGVGAGRADMLEDDVAAVTALSKLAHRAARPARRLPHQHHRTLPTPGCVNQRRRNALTYENADTVTDPRSSGTSQAASSPLEQCSADH